MENIPENGILVWRFRREDRAVEQLPWACPWCATELLRNSVYLGTIEVHHAGRHIPAPYKSIRASCPLCGWWLSGRQFVTEYEYRFEGLDPEPAHERMQRISDDPLASLFSRGSLWRKGRAHSPAGAHYISDESYITKGILRRFDLSSSELELSELGTHLRRNFSDVYNLRPRRFEELVEHVFRAQGFRTVLTQQSRDGGADIVFLSRDSDQKIAIVEVKRYAPKKKVGVDLIQRLMGAAIDWRVKRVGFVTTSDFTKDARDAARRNSDVYDFDLVAANDLLRLLGVYNENLPPLEKLSPKIRKEIIETAKRAR
jgi:restriction endonuclease